MDIEGPAKEDELTERGGNEHFSSSSSLSRVNSRLVLTSAWGVSFCRVGRLTQRGGVDPFSDCASLTSSAPQSFQRWGRGATPKASSIRILIRPAEKSTMAWSITLLIDTGVQPRACS